MLSRLRLEQHNITYIVYKLLHIIYYIKIISYPQTHAKLGTISSCFCVYFDGSIMLKSVLLTIKEEKGGGGGGGGGGAEQSPRRIQTLTPNPKDQI